ncbi:tetratricopeptide repeat-containing sulfotransferase family protein [Henriciella litoralis]|uniref:tetratricopeptide repeat-containing sulfotransferase family protein n=1 Tax=Henriciella litoralis TaxID=568102 RepID=UPI000A0408F9|nr:sulfotransferase [Henriciella litoralis]
MTDPDIKNARMMLDKGDYRAAHSICMDILRRSPLAGEPYLLLGRLAADHGNHTKALDLFDRSAELGFDPAEAFALKARSLVALSRREDAIKAAQTAAQYAPTDAALLDTIGVVFSRTGRHEEALPFYEKAAERAGRSAHIHYNRAVALQFVGRMDEAREAYERCLALDGSEVRALTGLVQVSRQTPEENRLAQLETAYENLSTQPADKVADQRLHLCHAIAKTLEDLGDPEAAMVWYGRGKEDKLKTLDYTFEQDAKLFDAAIKTLKFQFPASENRDAPVFIVGLPRTGTTLVDRILSSHPALTSAGELSDFALCLKREVSTPSRYVLDEETLLGASQASLAEVGQNYIQQVRDTLGVRGRFIDKMPLNAFYVPLILKALPHARVICLRRTPLDVVLSNYRQLFATSFAYYNYAFSLENTARYYAAFDRMIGAFRADLPSDRFTEIHYERVVADLEGETRRLLDFCGLEFDPACLSFHENAAPVATASSVQVRKPLYSSSIGRWRKVEAAMQPVLQILERHGIDPYGD